MEELIKYRNKVKIVVSTKQALFEERVNKELEKLENDGYEILGIDTNISFAGKEGYQMMACIKYAEEVLHIEYNQDDVDIISYNIGDCSMADNISFDPIPET